MSIPPNVIRIKRKRDDDAPVTFLQFDGEAKRHRSGTNWAYQRRQTAPIAPTIVSPKEARPVIHVAEPGNSLRQKQDKDLPQRNELSKQPPTATGTLQQQATQATPSRRFHISRSLLKKNEAAAKNVHSGISKRPRIGPAIFVEKTRRRALSKPTTDHRVGSAAHASSPNLDGLHSDINASKAGQTTKSLKKPGSASRIRRDNDAPTRAPLPATLGRHHEEDMHKIAEDLNKWVIDEISANLDSIEKERVKSQPSSPFRPKAPALRYRERHPEVTQNAESTAANGNMEVDGEQASDATEDEGDDGDWIIEEYIRIPLKAMAPDVSSTDVGVLVLDGEEATALFYGPENDSDDDLLEDDEDENAENHYTADYPEDEVDSDDEYGRQAYLYRTRNASDDEEFDKELYESSDDMVLDGDGDEDAAMARIKAYMRRHAAR